MEITADMHKPIMPVSVGELSRHISWSGKARGCINKNNCLTRKLASACRITSEYQSNISAHSCVLPGGGEVRCPDSFCGSLEFQLSSLKTHNGFPLASLHKSEHHSSGTSKRIFEIDYLKLETSALLKII